MKILLEVRTPGNGKSYEFQVDNTMSVTRAKLLMAAGITETENGSVTLKPDKITLYSMKTFKALTGDCSLTAAGVAGGQSLLLV